MITQAAILALSISGYFCATQEIVIDQPNMNQTFCGALNVRDDVAGVISFAGSGAGEAASQDGLFRSSFDRKPYSITVSNPISSGYYDILTCDTALSAGTVTYLTCEEAYAP